MPKANKELTQKCPLCGKFGILMPHPDKPEKFILVCDCNPSGPVLEMDAPAPEPKEVQK